MINRYNVACCETTTKNWTPTAKECYKLGCNCSKCILYKIYFYKYHNCKMKETVIELVKRFGAPFKEDI